jgi:hypothetical protein
VQNTLLWLETTAQLGAEAAAVIDLPATARWLGDRLGVPGQLMRDIQPLPQTLVDELSLLAGALDAGSDEIDHDRAA